jgi:hypothetical protein
VVAITHHPTTVRGDWRRTGDVPGNLAGFLGTSQRALDRQSLCEWVYSILLRKPSRLGAREVLDLRRKRKPGCRVSFDEAPAG